jgi:hypothetical protein
MMRTKRRERWSTGGADVISIYTTAVVVGSSSRGVVIIQSSLAPVFNRTQCGGNTLFARHALKKKTRNLRHCWYA